MFQVIPSILDRYRSAIESLLGVAAIEFGRMYLIFKYYFQSIIAWNWIAITGIAAIALTIIIAYYAYQVKHQSETMRNHLMQDLKLERQRGMMLLESRKAELFELLMSTYQTKIDFKALEIMMDFKKNQNSRTILRHAVGDCNLQITS
jgi:hypothetical protein